MDVTTDNKEEAQNIFQVPRQSEVELRGPQWDLAYAQLAPLVTEAYAFAELGESKRCLEVLSEAREVIKRVKMEVVRLRD